MEKNNKTKQKTNKMTSVNPAFSTTGGNAQTFNSMNFISIMQGMLSGNQGFRFLDQNVEKESLFDFGNFEFRAALKDPKIKPKFKIPKKTTLDIPSESISLDGSPYNVKFKNYALRGDMRSVQVRSPGTGQLQTIQTNVYTGRELFEHMENKILPEKLKGKISDADYEIVTKIGNSRFFPMPNHIRRGTLLGTTRYMYSPNQIYPDNVELFRNQLQMLGVLDINIGVAVFTNVDPFTHEASGIHQRADDLEDLSNIIEEHAHMRNEVEKAEQAKLEAERVAAEAEKERLAAEAAALEQKKLADQAAAVAAEIERRKNQILVEMDSLFKRMEQAIAAKDMQTAEMLEKSMDALGSQIGALNLSAAESQNFMKQTQEKYKQFMETATMKAYVAEEAKKQQAAAAANAINTTQQMANTELQLSTQLGGLTTGHLQVSEPTTAAILSGASASDIIASSDTVTQLREQTVAERERAAAQVARDATGGFSAIANASGAAVGDQYIGIGSGGGSGSGQTNGSSNITAGNTANPTSGIQGIIGSSQGISSSDPSAPPLSSARQQELERLAMIDAGGGTLYSTLLDRSGQTNTNVPTVGAGTQATNVFVTDTTNMGREGMDTSGYGVNKSLDGSKSGGSSSGGMSTGMIVGVVAGVLVVGGGAYMYSKKRKTEEYLDAEDEIFGIRGGGRAPPPRLERNQGARKLFSVSVNNGPRRIQQRRQSQSSVFQQQQPLPQQTAIASAPEQPTELFGQSGGGGGDEEMLFREEQ